MTKHIIQFFSLATFVLIANCSLATSYTWTGANSNDWYDSGNWNPSNVPGTGDDIAVNSGLCILTTGSVDLAGVVVSSGTLRVASGASMTMNGTCIVNGPGTLDVAGSVIINSNLDIVGTLLMSAGSISGAADLTIHNTLTWQSTSSVIDITGQFTNNGLIDITGGAQLKTTLFSFGTININGNFLFGDNANLINSGTMDFQDNSDVAYNSTNNSGIMNQGTIIKSGGSTTSDITVSLDNNGTMDCQIGRLKLSGGGVHGGDFNSTTPGYIAFAGTDSLVGGNAIGGSGMTTFEGTTLFVGADISVVNMKQTQGSFYGDGDITVSGAFEWEGGSLGDDAHPFGQIHMNGTFLIAGGDFLDAELNNNATTTWTTGSWTFGPSALFFNNSTMDIQTNADIFTSGAQFPFHNNGFLTKSAGTGITMFYCNIKNSGTINVNVGEIKFQNGGNNSGDIFIAAGAKVSASAGVDPFINQETGGIEGHGDFDIFSGDFLNNGYFKPGSSPGTLTINDTGGNIILDDTTVFQMEIGGTVQGTDYDHLIFTGGTIDLKGTLEIEIINGFTPSVGQVFTLITYSNLTGWFDTIYACTGDPSTKFNISDTGSEIIATVEAAVPVTSSLVDICQGDSTLIFGNYESVAGVYSNTLFSVYGCDSVLEVTLNVLPTYETTMPAVNICQGDSAMIFGAYQSVAGIYQDAYQTIDGCDSTFAVELIVDPVHEVTAPQMQICEGDSAMIFGNYYSVSGMYYDSLQTLMGCDSVLVQELVVTTIDATVTVTGTDLMANQAGAAYQWVDCDNSNAPIAGETNQTFTPGTNGNYAVEIVINGCAVQSGCELVEGIGWQESTVDPINIYPNPSTGQFVVEWGTAEFGLLSIVNTQGQLIYTQGIDKNEHHLQLNLDLEDGIYFLWVNEQVQRLVIND